MLILIIILIALFIVMYGRISKNNDLIKNNNKTIVDTANVKNAKRYFHNTKAATITLVIAVFLLLACIICEFSDIETKIVDMFSTNIIETIELDRKFYFFPLYFLIAREIYIQVRISEYLQKFFDDHEKEEKIDLNKLKEIDIKKILYKPAKAKQDDPNKVVRTNQINEILDVSQNENQNK